MCDFDVLNFIFCCILVFDKTETENERCHLNHQTSIYRHSQNDCFSRLSQRR